MKKKHFILTVLIIALGIFSILPITNYIVDPSRVLHHDYKKQYAKFHPHKLFLKIDYLLKHKKEYDTLVYGSSRGRFVDVSHISKHAYNMCHGFGTVTTYLHTLKVLLANGVKVKNVWVGVNDFDIWKDHTPELHRLINKNNFLLDLPIYSHWLFRFIPESLNLLKSNAPLIDTKEVTNPLKRSSQAREQEKAIINLKHRNIPPATLGYTGKFRIDEAVDEIRQIKELCESHGITLTVWLYPIYYKTYLAYNQNISQAFKRKLVQVTDFYDFYDFGNLGQNENYWFEGSHFTPTLADYMINNIQENKNLVTKENIEFRIKEIKQTLKSLVKLKLPNKGEGKGKGLYINPYSDMSIFPTIFDINDSNYSFNQNNQFLLTRKDNFLEATVTSPDPIIILNTKKTNAKHVMLTFSLSSKQESNFQLFFKETNSDAYNEKNIYYHKLHVGENNFRIIFASKYLNNGLRIDFTNKIGKYTIKKLNIRTIEI